jgi:hypothetical protein
MNAYIILKDKWSKTLTIPQAIINTANRNAILNSGTKYVGTFWAPTWEDAKKFFDKYCGY